MNSVGSRIRTCTDLLGFNMATLSRMPSPISCAPPESPAYPHGRRRSLLTTNNYLCDYDYPHTFQSGMYSFSTIIHLTSFVFISLSTWIKWVDIHNLCLSN